MARWMIPLAFLAACASTRTQPAVKQATFDVKHEVGFAIPKGARRVRIWMTQPQEDPAQEVRRLAVDSTAGPSRTVQDSEGNSYLYWELTDPEAAAFKASTSFEITRKEHRKDVDPAHTRPLTDADRKGKERYLSATQYVVINDRVRKLSKEIVGGEANPIKASRKIYDWVLENTQYWVKDPAHLKASPVGSTEYCLDTGTGNCTDFHSLYMSLSRAAGIPTRITYGSLFKTPLDGRDQDQSYHCWIEFYAPKVGWIPLDVAVADIFVGDFRLDDANRPKVTLTTADGYDGPDRKKVDYYFGNLEERRVSWSRGRDLTLGPDPKVGPVNALPKAHVVIDGRPLPAFDRKLTYKEVK